MHHITEIAVESSEQETACLDVVMFDCSPGIGCIIGRASIHVGFTTLTPSAGELLEIRDVSPESVLPSMAFHPLYQ